MIRPMIPNIQSYPEANSSLNPDDSSAVSALRKGAEGADLLTREEIETVRADAMAGRYTSHEEGDRVVVEGGFLGIQRVNEANFKVRFGLHAWHGWLDMTDCLTSSHIGGLSTS